MMNTKRASQISTGDYVLGLGVADHAAYVPVRYRKSMPDYAKTHVWVSFNGGPLREMHRSTIVTIVTR